MSCHEDDKLWSLDLKYENNDKIVVITFCICFPKVDKARTCSNLIKLCQIKAF